MNPRSLLLPAVMVAALQSHPGVLPAQVNRIYLAPDDHTDYLWSGTVADYEQWIPQMIDHYLDLNDSTAGYPAPYRNKWNCDGWYWVEIYKRNRPAAQFDRLIAQLQSGRITVPLNGLVCTHGGNTTEGVIRSGYYAGRLQRQYGIDIPVAISMENQTQPLGLASLWNGMGARYSWKGVCGCATQVPGLGQREHEIHRYTGLDGSGVLMKWYSLTYNQGLGGYAEAFDPNTAVDQCLDKLNSVAFPHNYPYTVAGAFGHGWDNTFTLDSSFPAVAMARSNDSVQCHVSNMKDFFEDFEATYGGTLPGQSLSFGNEWDLDCASIAEVTGRMRRGIERLRSAEAVAALAARYDPAVWTDLAVPREQAHTAIALYWEHNMGGGGVVPANDRALWQRGLEAQVTGYSTQLLNDAMASLGARIDAGGELRFVVVNPLGHQRTDVADLPYAGPQPVQVVDRTTATVIPSQVIQKDGATYIRILATAVPAAGYKVFTVQPGDPPVLPNTATLETHLFESDRFRISMSGEGVITSLRDKLANRSYAGTVNGRIMNDLGAFTAPGGIKYLVNNGPISATVQTEGVIPLGHDVRVTLYKDLHRVDVEDRITDNFSDTLDWAFGVQIVNATVHHEELGAILTARLSNAGGHYATQNARYDQLTLGHFADISNAQYGLSVSTSGPAFLRLGNSTVGSFDSGSSQLRFTAGGNFQGSGPGIPAQHGDTLFHYAFSLRPHEGPYDPVAAMRGALEHQNPLVVGLCTGTGGPYPDTSFGAFTFSDPHVMLWALKPAEEGIGNGLIARLWNVSDATHSTTLASPWGLEAAQTATHIETNTGAAPLSNGTLTASFGPQQMRTFRLTPGGPSVQLALRTALEGPWSTIDQLMRDDLRAAALLPLTEPYTALGYTHVGGGGETTVPAVLQVSGADAVVDWVVVELRDAATPSTVVATRCGLLQRDGDVVGTDGLSPLSFNAPAGSYRIAVRHRNHLGAMTAAAFALAGAPLAVDLTAPATATHGTDARKNLSGTMALWAGDVTFNGVVKYAGEANDRDPILSVVGGAVPTATQGGYLREDVNMDGVARYAGGGNDRDPILVNIGGAVPTAVRPAQLP
ncbi:MAG: glycoside hydrolase [Flavobacteriales bacterium]|nr:hypothetical protein [Flavobacteriales bacterium]MCC6577486.1 glycoside hydrolase [Flavobacteriales bacterium]NUQ14226.1 glycoside hydrolase [Flavobacteriales bacterium]